jgi:hypothetical protein
MPKRMSTLSLIKREETKRRNRAAKREEAAVSTMSEARAYHEAYALGCDDKQRSAEKTDEAIRLALSKKGVPENLLQDANLVGELIGAYRLGHEETEGR